MTGRTILVYLPGRAFGGAEQAALRAATGLRDRGWRPVIACDSGTALEPLIALAHEAGLPIERLPASGRVSGSWPGRAVALLRLVRRLHPALIHVHLGWPAAGLPGIVAGSLTRVPTVVTLHLWVPPRRRVRARWRVLGGRVRAWIAVSDGVADHLRRGLPVPAERVHVVRNGIPVARYAEPPASVAAIRAELGTPLVVAIAALRPQKRLDRLVSAATQLPGVHVAIAGDGPAGPELAAQAARLGIADRVHLLGFRPDVAALLHAADVVALPSAVEGLPLAILEAMAAGRPIVATDVEGTSELLEDGRTGILVPGDDPEALAAAIAELLADPVRAASLGRRAAEHVRAAFDEQRVIDELDRLFDGIAAPRERRSSGGTGRAPRPDPSRAREVDWRYLAGRARWERVIATTAGPGSSAVLADSVVRWAEGEDAGPPAPLVVTGPDDLATDGLAAAARALQPGGRLVVLRGGSWRPRADPLEAVAAAGIRPIGRWVAWPAPRIARWVRTDDRTALERHGAGLRRRRLGRRGLHALAWERLRRLGMLPDVTVGERLPGLTGSPFADLFGAEPPALLLVAGRRPENKVVAIAASPGADRRERVVKAVRDPSWNHRLAHEADVLAVLATRGIGAADGVPELLGRGLLEDGSLAIAETAVHGVRVSGAARRGEFAALALAGADWLARLAGATRNSAASDRARRAERAAEILDRFRSTYAPAIAVPQQVVDGLLHGLDELPIVVEHRDVAPWNLVRRRDGSLAAVDWESAEIDGWPGIDLAYLLVYLAFDAAGARSPRRQTDVHRDLLDPHSSNGRIHAAAFDRYAARIGVDAGALEAVVPFAWAVHALSEADRIAADHQGRPPPARLARGLFVRLWSQEVALPPDRARPAT